MLKIEMTYSIFTFAKNSFSSPETNSAPKPSNSLNSIPFSIIELRLTVISTDAILLTLNKLILVGLEKLFLVSFPNSWVNLNAIISAFG